MVVLKNKNITGSSLFVAMYTFFGVGLMAQNVFYCGYQPDNEGTELCDFMQLSAFTNNAEAERAVDMILRPLGLPRNFVLVSCPNINNALAITASDGLRYIVYDNDFINSIKGSSDWGAMSILAHELGHHLSGHTTFSAATLADQRFKEIQADEFAGFILYKLGASLVESQSAVLALPNVNGSDVYSTHPAKEKRLAAIEKGYKEALSLSKPSYVVTEPGPEAFLNNGSQAFIDGKYNDALLMFNEAIQANPLSALGFYYRGQTHKKLKNNASAIEDFGKAININTQFGQAYNYRGQTLFLMGEFQLAWSDMENAVRLIDKPDALIFYHRAMILERMKNHELALAEIDKALQLSNSSSFWLARGNINMHMAAYNQAIGDYTKAIDADQKFWIAYGSRALAYFNTHNYQACILDNRMVLAGNPQDPDAMLWISKAYLQLNSYEEALAELNKLIILKPDYGEAYFQRGVVHKNKVALDKAISDFNQALSFGYHNEWLYSSRAHAHYLSRNMQAALADYSKAIEIDPTNTAFYYGRAYVLQAIGELEKSCQDFGRACKLGNITACQESAMYCK